MDDTHKNAHDLIKAICKKKRRALPEEKFLAVALRVGGDNSLGEKADQGQDKGTGQWTPEKVRDLFATFGVQFTTRTLANWVHQVSSLGLSGHKLGHGDVVDALQHEKTIKGVQLVAFLDQVAGPRRIRRPGQHWYYWTPAELSFFIQSKLMPPRLLMTPTEWQAHVATLSREEEASSKFVSRDCSSSNQLDENVALGGKKRKLQRNHLKTVSSFGSYKRAADAVKGRTDAGQSIESDLRSRMKEKNLELNDEQQAQLCEFVIEKQQLSRLLKQVGFDWVPLQAFTRWGGSEQGKWIRGPRS
jgi:hypothetical protein